MEFDTCRICLHSKHTKFKNIFTSTESFSNKELKLIDAIVECAPIQINENDNLPKNICLKCLEKLQITYEFRQVCVESDLKLKLSLEPQKATEKILIKEENQNTNDTHLIECVRKESDVDKISCEECGKTYASAKSFQRHLQQAHPIKCIHCNQKFPNENDLYIHNEKFHIFRCELCAETFIWKIEIEKHYNEIHLSTSIKIEDPQNKNENYTVEDDVNSTELISKENEYFSDDPCHNKSDDSFDLKEPEKLFKCNQCKKILKSKSSLQIHIRTHTGERPYACDTCDKSFKSQSHLIVHKRIHTGEKNYMCELCPKSFSTGSDLKKHTKVHFKSKNSVPTFQCYKCEKTFVRKLNLERHIEIIHKQIEEIKFDSSTSFFKCEICDQNFVTNSDLKLHIKITHNQKIPGEIRAFTCPNCGKGFISKIELDEHFLTHAGNLSFMCDICGYVCERNQTLKIHMLKMHTGTKGTPKPISCHICSKEFIYKSILRKHLPTHDDIMPYKCKLCPKRFKWRVGLWRHEKKVHTGERNYKCPECGKGFIEANHLRLHIRVHTGERPYKCEICFKTFKQGLSHHMKQCHSKT